MTMDLDITTLLFYALTGDASSDGPDTSKISDTCLELFERDNECETLENTNGTLCNTYPNKIFVPLPAEGGNYCKLKDFVLKARFARTRGRFVAPVLVFGDKYVCRSSTLARSPEIYYRQTYGYWMQGEATKPSDNVAPADDKEPDFIKEADPKLVDPDLDGNEWMVDKMRNADISLLQYLKVNVIFDLMVEKKKVKYGMNVTSSEKADKSQRYEPFSLISVPYPGCEFFVEYRDSGYNADTLKYDWKQAFVDATLQLPSSVEKVCNVAWDDYTNWDLVTLTQNYLLLHLRLLVQDDCDGILLHCISGWDRTPLFVSLMRLSLWADGLAHTNLSAREMAYFTIAYDWFLFQHQFIERISNGEEIFFFCFDFLKYICDDKYSLSRNQFNGESAFTNSNGHTKPASNGNSTHSLERSDSLAHCNDGNTVEYDNSSTLIAASEDIEKSYTPPDPSNQSNVNPGEQTAVLHVQQTDAPDEDPTTVPAAQSYRHIRLMELRSLVMEAYKETIQLLNEREQTKNTGLAATLMNQISKTFSLVKK